MRLTPASSLPPPAYLALALLLAAGCGDNAPPPAADDGGQAEVVAPALGGSIVGTVTDLADGAALAGAHVYTLVPGRTGATVVADATDGRGAFALGGLPAAGTYRVIFAADGYVDRFADVTLPGEADLDDTVVTRDMALAAADAALEGTVTGNRGAPAAGAVVVLDLREDGFDLVAQASAGPDGSYSLAGLPGAPTGLYFAVAVQPFDADADGAADYTGAAFAVTTWSGRTTRLDIDLRPLAVPLALLDSDLETGTHAAATPLALRFNLPLDETATTAALEDVDLGFAVGTSATVDGATLAVSPASGTPLAEGHVYELQVAAAGGNGATLAVTRRFQVVTGPTTELPPVAGLVVQPLAADAGTRDFTLEFAAVPGAAGYHVFARDTAGNPSFLLVATSGSAPAPHLAVTLPAAFDVFSGDALVTPLAAHTRVDFAVVPVDVYGHPGDPATAAVVSRTDTVRPTILAAVPDRSADNSGGATAATVLLDVDFSEYLDPLASNLALALPAAGMSAVFVLDAPSLTGRFTITVPALTDGRGACTFSGAVDTSGNLMLPSSGALP